MSSAWRRAIATCSGAAASRAPRPWRTWPRGVTATGMPPVKFSLQDRWVNATGAALMMCRATGTLISRPLRLPSNCRIVIALMRRAIRRDDRTRRTRGFILRIRAGGGGFSRTFAEGWANGPSAGTPGHGRWGAAGQSSFCCPFPGGNEMAYLHVLSLPRLAALMTPSPQERGSALG